MTPRQENDVKIMVGQLMGHVEGMRETLAELKQKADEAINWRHEVKERLEKMETHGGHMTQVAKAFEALQRSIHEGTLQAKAYSKGILLGVGIAAGGAGAFVSTGIKWVYTTFFGA